MKLLNWMVYSILFFSFFAFSLNNQHEVQLNWFFGHAWVAPLVLVVLASFAAGCFFGVLVLLPGWWRGRNQSKKSTRRTPDEAPTLPPPSPLAADDRLPDHPPRDGL